MIQSPPTHGRHAPSPRPIKFSATFFRGVKFIVSYRGRVGEWESGRVGEWESGRVRGEWESEGRVGEWESESYVGKHDVVEFVGVVEGGALAAYDAEAYAAVDHEMAEAIEGGIPASPAAGLEPEIVHAVDGEEHEEDAVSDGIARAHHVLILAHRGRHGVVGVRVAVGVAYGALEAVDVTHAAVDGHGAAEMAHEGEEAGRVVGGGLATPERASMAHAVLPERGGDVEEAGEPRHAHFIHSRRHGWEGDGSERAREGGRERGRVFYGEIFFMFFF